MRLAASSGRMGQGTYFAHSSSAARTYSVHRCGNEQLLRARVVKGAIKVRLDGDLGWPWLGWSWLGSYSD